MPDATYIACPRCGEPYAMTAMQKRLFHGRTLTCQRCAKPFTITEQTPDPVPAPKVQVAPPTNDDVVELPPPKPVTTDAALPASDRGEGLSAVKMAMIIALVAVGVCTLLYFAVAPSVRRSREAAHRVTCASNLAQIGSALQLYANGNGGRFPDSLDVIVADGSLPAEMLICPSTEHTPAAGKTPAEQAANLGKGKHVSYVYIGKGLGFGATKQPIAYEPLSDHQGEGVHVLYTDGSVQFLPRAGALVAVPQLAAGGATTTTKPVPQTMPR
jgi:hypothetical protein